MATEVELQLIARLRAHEILIQNLLRLVFNNDSDAIRDFAARQHACLDTTRFSDFQPAMSARLSYEAQEAIAKILEGAILLSETQQSRKPSAKPEA
jgi:hypothetical protein